MRPLSFWIGTAFLSLGVVVLLIAGGVFAIGYFEDLDYSNAVSTATALAQIAPTQTATKVATPIPPTATPAPTPTPVPAGTEQASSSPTAAPSALPATATSTSTPATAIETATSIYSDSPRAASRIKIPVINLDAPVAESIISNSQWVVPRFAAGHLQGTAQPGGPGNAAYAGHVSSISSGNVFANIGKLAPGDQVILGTSSGDLFYQVSGKTVVKNTDLSVIQDFGDQRITLITCTGTWLPLQRDYNQRLVVVAMRVG